MGNGESNLQVLDSLPGMGVDPDTIVVTGFSAGAIMAHQLHLTYSGTFKGAAMVCGSSYNANAYYPLAGADLFGFYNYERDAQYLAKKGTEDARANSEDGLIDPVTNLKNQPVYVQQNQLDDVLPPELQEAQNIIYENFESNINFAQKPFIHGWPTDVPEDQWEVKSCEDDVNYGRMLNCGVDTAGEILNHLYPNLDGSTVQAKDPDWMTNGKLIYFDQNEFIDSWPFEYTGLGEGGALYVPDQCLDGSKQCKLLLFLHGAFESFPGRGYQNIKNTGFGDYASSNDFIIMFPNTATDWAWNPAGCWDFGGWGMSDFQDRYVTNKGIQTQAIKKMVDRLKEPFDSSFSPKQNVFTDWEEPSRGGPPSEDEGGPPDQDTEYTFMDYVGLFGILFMNLFTNFEFFVSFGRILLILPFTFTRLGWRIYGAYTFERVDYFLFE